MRVPATVPCDVSLDTRQLDTDKQGLPLHLDEHGEPIYRNILSQIIAANTPLPAFGESVPLLIVDADVLRFNVCEGTSHARGRVTVIASYAQA